MLSQKLVLSAAGAGAEATYVDDVFGTQVRKGSGTSASSTVAVVNNIDLAGEGGVVWIKERNDSNSHTVFSSEIPEVSGRKQFLRANSSLNATTQNNIDINFNSDGYTVIGHDGQINQSNGNTYVDWTFRRCPGFFDVVTFTGDGSYARNISHNLGSVPGSVWVKRLSGSDDWVVYHRGADASSPQDYVTFLNGTGARSNNDLFADTAPTASVFTVGSNVKVNGSGSTYVAYLFAHDEQTFGDNGNEAIIKCGSYTGSGSTGKTVDLGFEPQWMLVKSRDQTRPWVLIDNIRGMTRDGDGPRLLANDSAAEVADASFFAPTPTGVEVTLQNTYVNTSGENYIYIAIRRPHKPPSAGTDVLSIDTRGSTGDGNAPTYRSNFPVDWYLNRNINYSGGDMASAWRLLAENVMYTSQDSSESVSTSRSFDYNNGVEDDTGSSTDQYSWMFTRFPKVFDVVCYEGNGTNGRQISHGLKTVPEMVIVKTRGNPTIKSWLVYHKDLAIDTADHESQSVMLNSTGGAGGYGALDIHSEQTSTYFTLRSNASSVGNYSSQGFVAMCFATFAGITKVGSYSGSSSSVDVDCGFTNGARFVLIKRTDNNGNWMLFDTSRGIVSGNDPYLQLNNTNANNSSSDLVDPLAAGFTVNSGNGNVNTSGASYIFLAIA